MKKTTKTKSPSNLESKETTLSLIQTTGATSYFPRWRKYVEHCYLMINYVVINIYVWSAEPDGQIAWAVKNIWYGDVDWCHMMW